MKPPINSEKHIVQQTPTSVSMGATFAIPMVEAAQSPSLSKDVRVGAVVKACYVELWVISGGAAVGSTITTVEKLVSGQDFAAIGDMTNLNSYANKKNILETHQGILGDMNTNTVPFYRGWIKIPKGKQRFGQGDRLVLNVFGLSSDVDFCGVFIYKEYF